MLENVFCWYLPSEQRLPSPAYRVSSWPCRCQDWKLGNSYAGSRKSHQAKVLWSCCTNCVGGPLLRVIYL